MKDRMFDELVANQQMLYEQTGRTGARPSANLIGIRADQPFVSVSVCPSSHRDMVNKFAAAGLVLSTMDVDEACLVVGDEWAEAVLHSDDLGLPADGYAAVIVAGARPRGVVRPYEYDRGAGRIHWASSSPLRLSITTSLWAEVLAPQALGDGIRVAGPMSLVAEIVALNEALGNEVLVLEQTPASAICGNSLN